MSPNLESLTNQILALPVGDRVELARLLWVSLEGQVSEEKELFAEIKRRDNEISQGTARTYTHDEVMRDARKIIEQ